MDDEELREIFAALGPITIRRMFGGKGIYFRGVIVAVVYQDELRLKADVVSAPEFEAAGAAQWAYRDRRGKVMMPYWSVPHEAFDSTDLMAHWIRRAYEGGLRNQDGKRRRSGKRVGIDPTRPPDEQERG